MSRSRNTPPGSGDEDRSGRRWTIYIDPDIDNALQAQAEAEGTSKARVINDLLQLLLMTPDGQVLCQRARDNNRKLSEEVERALVFPSEELSELYRLSSMSPAELLEYLSQELPLEEIVQLGRQSQRNPAQMLAHLILVAIPVVRRRMERAASDIED